jgi:hypothetical protein
MSTLLSVVFIGDTTHPSPFSEDRQAVPASLRERRPRERSGSVTLAVVADKGRRGYKLIKTTAKIAWSSSNVIPLGSPPSLF